MPRGQPRSVTEIQTRGRKGGEHKHNDVSALPQKRTTVLVNSKAAQKADKRGIIRKKNPGLGDEDPECSKNEKTENKLDEKTVQDEALPKNEDKKDKMKPGRKRKVDETKDEAKKDIERNVSEDKIKASKGLLKKIERSDSEKEDASKETESNAPMFVRQEGKQEMGLRRTRNTRRSESFSSDGERDMEKRSSSDIINKLDKKEGKTAQKNKSAKEIEGYSSDREKNIGPQHDTDNSADELARRGMKSTRQTRITRQTDSLSSDRESDLKHQDATDIFASHEPIKEGETSSGKTRSTRRSESLTLDMEKDLKPQNATDASKDKDLALQRTMGVCVTRNTRSTESLSSDGEKDIKQQNTADTSASTNLVQQKAKGISNTRNTKQTESLSSDGETDVEQHHSTTIVLENEPEKKGAKYTRQTRNTRRSGSYSSDWEKDIRQQNTDPVLTDKNLKKRGRKSAKSRFAVHSESCSSDMENDVNCNQEKKIVNVAANAKAESSNDAPKEKANTETDEQTKFNLPRTRRAKRMEDSSSDRENDRTETDQTSQSECEMEVSNRKESLCDSREYKLVDNNSEAMKDKDGIHSDDEGIKVSCDIKNDMEQKEKMKETTGNKEKNNEENHSLEVDNLNVGEIGKEGNKNEKASAVERRMRNARVVDEVKEKSAIVKRVGRKPKNIRKVESESDSQDKDGKETDNAEGNKKETGITFVRTRNARKGEELNRQKLEGEKRGKLSMERKTRNASKKEKDAESNEDYQHDDATSVEILETNSVETAIVHKVSAIKKMPATRASKSSKGSDIESCKTDDGISDNKMDVSDSSDAGVVETKEVRTGLPDVNKKHILKDLGDASTNVVEVPNKSVLNAEDGEPSGSSLLVSRGRRQRRRVAKVPIGGKMSTRSIKKFSEDWKESLKNSEIHQTTEVENRETEDLPGQLEIDDTCSEIIKRNILKCKVSVVIKKLDLNDPQICKLISDYDLNVLKADKETFDQSSNIGEVESESSVSEFFEKANESLEITNEVEIVSEEKTNFSIAIESQNIEDENKTEKTNMSICSSNEVTNESSHIVESRDAQLLQDAEIDSFSTTEIALQNLAEKVTSDSIAENVIVINVDTVDTLITSELNSESPSHTSYGNAVMLDKELNENAVHEKNIELKANVPEDQESENTEIDGIEDFSESISTTNLDLSLENVSNKKSSENVLPGVFSRYDLNIQKDESPVNVQGNDDSEVMYETNEDMTSENDEFLEIEEFENKSEEENVEIKGSDFKESNEYKQHSENSVSLESTVVNIEDDEENKNECLENNTETIVSENENLPKATNNFATIKENVEESKLAKVKSSRHIPENINHDLNSEQSNESEEIFIHQSDEELVEVQEELENSLQEETVVESKGSNNSNSESLEEHKREVLSTDENSIKLSSFDKSKVAEISNKLDPTEDKSEESEQDILEATSDMLEQIECEVVDSENVEMERKNVDSVEEYSEQDSIYSKKENENDISVEACNVDKEQQCFAKKDLLISLESNENVCKLIVEEHQETANDNGKSDSPAPTMYSPKDNTTANANLEEESSNNKSELVLEETSEVENITKQVNEYNEEFTKTASVCHDVTKESSEIVPICSAKEIQFKEGKISLFPKEVPTEVKKNDCKEKIKNVKRLMDYSELVDSAKCVKKRKLENYFMSLISKEVPTDVKKTDCQEKIKSVKQSVDYRDMLDSAKCVKKTKLDHDGLHQQKDKGGENSAEKMRVIVTDDTNVYSETNKGKTATEFCKKPCEVPAEKSLCDDQSQPGPSFINFLSKKSAKSKNTGAKHISIPRWPRMPWAPVRIYLEQFVPLLLEGLLSVNLARPDDPIQYLAQWMVENKTDVYFRMIEDSTLSYDERKSLKERRSKQR